MPMSLGSVVHLLLHAVVPAVVAVTFYRASWRSAWLVMLAGWLIDVDHLLANPIYDPGRCSIGYHPLHRWPAIVFYLLLLGPRKTRLLGVGLIIHIVLDALDCLRH
jgi:hypothetical protein